MTTSTPNLASSQALPLLLIEDERSVMDFIRTALERNGYACATAQSAADGIRQLESGSFGGIISDMRTPGGASGADVHSWILAHRPQLKDRMLFITGDRDPLCRPEHLHDVQQLIRSPYTSEVVPGDHSFKPPARSGRPRR